MALSAKANAQSYTAQYYKLVTLGDSLYEAKDYKAAALSYSKAFRANKWVVKSDHRYNAACSWALAGNADSAINNLLYLANKENFSSYKHVTTDPDLTSLYNDKRWPGLTAKIKQNLEKAEANYNKPLVAQLDSIYANDQGLRQQIQPTQKKYGMQSKELADLYQDMAEKDSIDLIKVEYILDKYGWLGADKISERGSLTLFLVIQHADQQTQEKYLPMMRAAVAKKNANAANLALLEDRVAMGQGKKQIYGSQIRMDQAGKASIYPIEDEINVNKRRAAVGLPPLEEYVKYWGIVYKPLN